MTLPTPTRFSFTEPIISSVAIIHCAGSSTRRQEHVRQLAVAIFSISASDPNRNPDVPNSAPEGLPGRGFHRDQRPGAGGGGADRAGDFDSHAFLYSSGMMYDLNDLVTVVLLPARI